MEPACEFYILKSHPGLRPQPWRNTIPRHPRSLMLLVSITPLLVFTIKGSSLDFSIYTPLATGCLLSRPNQRGPLLAATKAHTVGQIPEFWVDILQVPLEALAPQIPPQVQSALNAGGREDKTRLCQRQVLGWEAHGTPRAHARRPHRSGGHWKNELREISRAPDRAMETLSNSSPWCSNDTKDLYFNLKMDFGGVLTFH